MLMSTGEVMELEKGKNVISIEDRIPKIKQQRRKKANRRLIFLLLLFFILISIILYFQSPLSRVQSINVEGNIIYSKDKIISSAGIAKDVNIWKINEKEIEQQIKNLAEVKAVSVTTKLPTTVKINIQEFKRIAYISEGKNFIPVLENGKILQEEETNNLPLNAPILFDFTENDALKEMIIGLDELPKEVLNAISEIHYEPIESDAYHIYLFMNDGNEVSATIRTFAEKMSHYSSIIGQLDPNQKGVINLEVGSYFKAFEPEESVKEEGT